MERVQAKKGEARTINQKGRGGALASGLLVINGKGQGEKAVQSKKSAGRLSTDPKKSVSTRDLASERPVAETMGVRLTLADDYLVPS